MGAAIRISPPRVPSAGGPRPIRAISSIACQASRGTEDRPGRRPAKRGRSGGRPNGMAFARGCGQALSAQTSRAVMASARAGMLLPAVRAPAGPVPSGGEAGPSRGGSRTPRPRFVPGDPPPRYPPSEMQSLAEEADEVHPDADHRGEAGDPLTRRGRTPSIPQMRGARPPRPCGRPCPPTSRPVVIAASCGCRRRGARSPR